MPNMIVEPENEDGMLKMVGNTFKALRRAILGEPAPKVAVVRLYGVIAPGRTLDGFGGAVTEVKGLVEKPKAEDAPSNLIISGAETAGRFDPCTRRIHPRRARASFAPPSGF